MGGFQVTRDMLYKVTAGPLALASSSPSFLYQEVRLCSATYSHHDSLAHHKPEISRLTDYGLNL